jgi:hypothetical protein
MVLGILLMIIAVYKYMNLGINSKSISSLVLARKISNCSLPNNLTQHRITYAAQLIHSLRRTPAIWIQLFV